MWLEIRREPGDVADPEEAGVAAATPAEPSSGGGSLEQDDFAGEEEAVENSITLSPGLLLGTFAIAVACVVLAGAGLWLAGQASSRGSARGVGGIGSLAAVPTPVVPAVAVVNGEPITLKQLDDLVAINVVMASLAAGQPVNLTPQQWQQARSELLNQVIRNTLILQAARGAGITVSDNQVQAEWLAWLRKYELTPTQLDTQLAQAGASREVLQEWLRNALMANLYLTQYLAQGAAPEERTQIYEQWIQKQLESAQIQIYQPTTN